MDILLTLDNSDEYLLDIAIDFLGYTSHIALVWTWLGDDNLRIRFQKTSLCFCPLRCAILIMRTEISVSGEEWREIKWGWRRLCDRLITFQWLLSEGLEASLFAFPRLLGLCHRYLPSIRWLKTLWIVGGNLSPTAGQETCRKQKKLEISIKTTNYINS